MIETCLRPKVLMRDEQHTLHVENLISFHQRLSALAPPSPCFDLLQATF